MSTITSYSNFMELFTLSWESVPIKLSVFYTRATVVCLVSVKSFSLLALRISCPTVKPLKSFIFTTEPSSKLLNLIRTYRIDISSKLSLTSAFLPKYFLSGPFHCYLKYMVFSSKCLLLLFIWNFGSYYYCYRL